LHVRGLTHRVEAHYIANRSSSHVNEVQFMNRHFTTANARAPLGAGVFVCVSARTTLGAGWIASTTADSRSPGEGDVATP
jgi:hypothetical protein